MNVNIEEVIYQFSPEEQPLARAFMEKYFQNYPTKIRTQARLHRIPGWIRPPYGTVLYVSIVIALLHYVMHLSVFTAIVMTILIVSALLFSFWKDPVTQKHVENWIQEWFLAQRYREVKRERPNGQYNVRKTVAFISAKKMTKTLMKIIEKATQE